ncbi:MAG: flagellar biosynthesis protein FlhA [Chitinivibrionales bacterium]|nr:flagellar biosynthesis protein FlhA [Chitinivibrionales bacterium]
MNLQQTLIDVSRSPGLSRILRQRDLIIVLGIVGILIVMIIPIPTWTVDILLSVNLCIALIILLVSMYNKEALQFSVFPSLLLAVTLFRLALNIGSTRLILSQADAGKVIAVFGTFVTANNALVGFIIFCIIMLIQFIVITKGAGRIAEVAARFTLDAMPGKQMAIDADLNSGLISEQQARERRSQISREADFYGAMDGASKFVKGDAVAGIIITLINIIGGFIIGIVQQGMSFQESLSVYTALTIGDGLVTQIPALMISTGSGILVSRAASADNLGTEISQQLFSNPKVLAIAGGVMFLFVFIPGFPKIPFFMLAVFSSAAAYMGFYSEKEKVRNAKSTSAPPVQTQEDKIEHFLHVDPMELEIGYGLIPLVDAKQGGDLLDRISQIRRQIASTVGIIIPPVRIRDNIQLKPNQYIVKIRMRRVGDGELMSGSYLAMNPGNVTTVIRGIKTTEPAFGLPALWITEGQKEAAELAGYTVVELPAVLSTHLTELIKRHSQDLLTRQDVHELVNTVKEHNQAVVDELIPNKMSLGEVHKVLQNLLREKVSIRDLPRILECLGDVAGKNKNIDILTEYVRDALAAQICDEFISDSHLIPVITLDPNVEAKLESSLTQTDAGLRLNLSPTDASRIIEATGKQVETVRSSGDIPIILCAPTIRSPLKRLTENHFPNLVVLSYNEIISGVEIRSSGMVSLANN